MTRHRARPRMAGSINDEDVLDRDAGMSSDETLTPLKKQRSKQLSI